MALLVFDLLGCAAPAAGPQRLTFTRPLMGSAMSIVLYSESQTTDGLNRAAAAARAAFQRMADLEAVFSDYRPESELNRLCAAAGGPPVRVSTDLFDILRAASVVSQATQGAFDVTIGPLTHLWRAARQTGVPPDARDIEAARPCIDWRLIEFDDRTRSVRLARPGMQLDLGAIGKGWAADAAAEVLQRGGLTRYMVDAGGSLRTGDPPPQQDGWPVVIDSGLQPETRLRLRLRRCGIATSGDAAQFIKIGPTRRSHIIDPETGEPVRGRTAATVIADDAATADALATALDVLGPERGLPLLARRYPGVRARMVIETPGCLKTWQTPAFEAP
jgi:thiamine biosynthesis lipoprotein